MSPLPERPKPVRVAIYQGYDLVAGTLLLVDGDAVSILGP